MRAQIRIVAGPDAGRTFPLPEGTALLIGRGRDTMTRLTDPQVSRLHCRIDVRGEQALLTDLDSSSGTFVNGVRVTKHPLEIDDVILIGDTQLCLEDLDVADHETVLPAGAVPLAPRDGLPAERMGELTGTQLASFEVGPELAKGQSGLVFKARDIRDGQSVALKVLWPEFSRDPKEVRRFVRAMRTMLPMRHPHLVAVYGAGRTGPYCWIAMEFIDGDSLANLIQRVGKAGTLDWRQALRVGVHVARALIFAHHHNVVHRNVSPQNILIRSSDRVAKLGDLMLAKAQEGKLAEQITRPGELLGNVSFMSPERTSGDLSQIDGRADIYSLGATLFALIAGRPPLEGKSFVETLLKIRQHEPPRLKALQPAVPGALDNAIATMLAKRPEDRYQRAVDLVAELDRIARAEKVEV